MMVMGLAVVVVIGVDRDGGFWDVRGGDNFGDFLCQLLA